MVAVVRLVCLQALSAMENAIEGKDFNFSEQERSILEFWTQIDAFKQQLKRTEGCKEYVFFDGPPFATGLPHYGHILAGTIKVRLFVPCCHEPSVQHNTLCPQPQSLVACDTHAWQVPRTDQMALQDVVTRYASQTGHHVERRFGWDCHGLPVEFEIDKKLSVSLPSPAVRVLT